MDKMKQFSEEIYQSNQHDNFTTQQAMYGKFSTIYDEYCIEEGYHGHKRLLEKIIELYPKQRDIRILDYGCGTGLAADCLTAEGFEYIDGLDPCKELLDVARSKGKYKTLYNMSSNEDDSMIPSASYDLICSSGVFFGSPSYPGFECIANICRYVKPGGLIVICTGNCFVDTEQPGYQKIKELEEKGRIEVVPNEVFENYRDSVHKNEGGKPLQGIFLMYRVL